MNAISRSFTGRKRIRHSFGRIPEVAPMPNLIDVQRASYEAFLQMNVQHDSRLHAGLQEVFKSVFPIDDFAGRGRLEFVYYELEEPKYDVEECIQRGMTYAAPLKVVLRLIVWDVDEDTGARSIRDIKEQPVYMGDMPLMTDNGTFIINGTERVIVSQMHRSPGVFFDHDKGKTHSSGKYLFQARVIPYRGSWLDFEFDAKDCVFARIDRRRKLPVTILLRALGYSNADILRLFFDRNTVHLTKKGVELELVPERLRGETAMFEISANGKVIVEEGRRITARHVRQLEEAGVKRLAVPVEYLDGKILSHDVADPQTGEVLASANDVLNPPLV